MTARVLAHADEDVGVRFDAAQERVARRAECSANGTRPMVVVHEQVAGYAADQAPTVLRGLEVIYLLGRQTVLALVAGAQILRLRGIGILPAPFTQTLVAPFTVGYAVGAVPSARAFPTFGALLPPLGEVPVWEFAGAEAARHHGSTMPRGTDMLEQPCHADVLLELADGVPR